ncbi:arylamine N-acetyltransferase family protein, partial [Singulisphaera rosea]
GSEWLADVGFGAEGLLKPIALATRQTLRRHDRCYRLVVAEGPWILQSSKADDWQDLYEFSWEPQYLVDYEVANYFVSTHPTSVFRRNLVVQLSTPEGRYLLKNRELSSERAGATCHRTIESDDELLDVLSSTFGLDFPSGTQFKVEPSDQGPCL